jgi:energy-coupling factor transporter ATP-binding protein EcfA2
VDTLHVDLARALRAFRLELALEVDGVVALAGPSGAGKSTVLRTIAGLSRPDKGRVALGETVWFDSEGEDRRAARGSVGRARLPGLRPFPAHVRRGQRGLRRREAERELLARFGIESLARSSPESSRAESANGSPWPGRSRATQASSSSTSRSPRSTTHTRARVRGELRGLLKGLDLPTLVVTHSFEDAAALTDSIGVLVEGQLVQTGSAADLVAAPTTPFVADFTGANLLTGRARATGDGLTEVVLADGKRDRLDGSADGKGRRGHPSLGGRDRTSDAARLDAEPRTRGDREPRARREPHANSRRAAHC